MAKTIFAKGDRVRLISIDGKLHDQVFTIHDRWGDDDRPANASYLYGNTEQLSHTELMKHEDDSSPVIVPEGGEWYIAVGNAHNWGRAQTIKGALVNMRRAGAVGRRLPTGSTG